MPSHGGSLDLTTRHAEVASDFVVEELLDLSRVRAACQPRQQPGWTAQHEERPEREGVLWRT
ncbi:hypothetical protein GCM10022225_85050 [Plantactinospora mayteni]|uniref:Uncharacterized protein n=1 Tax=Plantactinospora mayteni TaxID=566021 RepID=A0ABQ4F4X0_9ACTN|nr:hypothetical protein Pma05_85020 [Plantactinospora mayteni]